jgi:lysophospholipase L1-like esterase
MFALSAAFGALEAYVRLVGEDPRVLVMVSMFTSWPLLFFWCKADAAYRAISPPFGAPLLVAIFAPVSIPYYFLRTRPIGQALLATAKAVGVFVLMGITTSLANVLVRLCTVFSLAAFVFPLLLAAQAPAAPAEVRVGVVADPCRGVPQASTPLDWSQRCRYSRENSQLPPPSPGRVVFMGDSITEAWKAAGPHLFVNDILDRGISGQTTEQMIVRFRADVIDLKPRVVHIMAGTNDIAGNTGPTSLHIIQGNIKSMVEQAQLHHIKVVLASILPAVRFPWRAEIKPAATIATMNRWLRKCAECAHIVFVDYYDVLNDGSGGLNRSFSEDGVHPNAAGYTAMTPLARAALAQAMSAPDTAEPAARDASCQTL